MSARHIIASVSKGRMDDAMRECSICACGTKALHGEPERIVGDITHGVLVCFDGLPPPECCRDCGEPFNDADAPASGMCGECGAGEERVR